MALTWRWRYCPGLSFRKIGKAIWVCGIAMAALNPGGCAISQDGSSAIRTTAASKGQIPAKPAHAPGRSVLRIDPRTLVGLDENQIRQVLGSPGIIWEEAPSRVWRFTAGRCSLDLFFYLDLGSSRFRALSYTIATPANAPPRDAADICVGSIQTQYRAKAERS